MENQHRKIVGYRELTQADIDMMNRIKTLAAEFKALDLAVAAHINAQFEATKDYISADEEHERDLQAARDAGKPESEVDIPSGMVKTPQAQAEWERLVAAEPHRWRSIATTGMQQALMAMTRAVAQPSSF